MSENSPIFYDFTPICNSPHLWTSCHKNFSVLCKMPKLALLNV